ncbi:MAG: sel1 repeat family protein [Rhizobacter sp.]|nr:sel1 repeat family protein [Rhizobacter sp.]
MSIARIIATLVLSLAIVPARADALQDGIAAMHRKDYAAALRLLEPLALAGQPQAQLRLGQLHYHGHGVPESDARAVQWFERAARQGLAEAQFQLGNMYAYGLADPGGGADPHRLAAQWYFEAARQGHSDAQYSLGILFLSGTGVVQDAGEAARWIERAAAQGHADAAAYLRGKGS